MLGLTFQMKILESFQFTEHTIVDGAGWWTLCLQIQIFIRTDQLITELWHPVLKFYYFPGQANDR